MMGSCAPWRYIVASFFSVAIMPVTLGGTVPFFCRSEYIIEFRELLERDNRSVVVPVFERVANEPAMALAT